jgi:hypothetical protein
LSTGWVSASLAEKIPEQAIRRDTGPLQRLLEDEALGLDVEWEFSLTKRWLQVRGRGEDAEAFINVVTERFGSIPLDGSRVEKWDVVKGYVVAAGRVGFGVYVDLGILEPVAKDALYPLHKMRAQLSDGALKPCREILEENGLVDDFPVRIRVIKVEGEKITVELSDVTKSLFDNWRKLPFDRVVAVGVGRDDVEKAVKAARLSFDVIRIEPLSLFTQCLVCKIGTDAPGVIVKIGNRLKGVRLAAVRALAKA